MKQKDVKPIPKLFRSKDLNIAYANGYSEALYKVIKIVSDWKDTSIKVPNSNIALMLTNGGYISKFALLKELEKLK